MKQKVWLRNLILSVLVGGIFILLSEVLIPFTFEVNDDVSMICILNGSFTGTPDAHTIYMGYALSFFIMLLYKTGIAICWYKWVLYATYIFALSSLLYRLLDRFPKHPILLSLATAGSVAVLWLTRISRGTFSTCGAFLTVTLILCYALQPKEKDLKPGWLADILLLFVLCCNWREQFSYLSIAFLGVVWLFKYWKELLSNKKCWLIPLSALLLLGCSLGIKSYAYRDWDDYFTYNAARSYLQDRYHFPKYSEHPEELLALGYTEEEYYTLSHYDYALLRDFGPEDIIALADYAKTLEPEQTPGERMTEAVQRAWDYFIITDFSDITPVQIMSFVMPALLILCTIVLCIKDRKNYAIFPVLLLFGLVCSWVYIGSRGRFPDRVDATLRLLNVGVSLAGFALLLIQRPIRIKGQKLQRALSALLCVLFMAGSIWSLSAARTRQLELPSAFNRYIKIAAQHPENIYFRDTRSISVSYRVLSEFPRMPVNVVYTGSWDSYSPLYYEKLETLGLDGLSQDTLLQDNAYLVVRLSKYDLHQVLGLAEDVIVNYDEIERLGNGILIIKINEIIYPD